MKGRCLFCQHQWSYLYIIALEHTKKTIEALAENYTKESDVFIFSDAAKNEKSIANVQLTENI